MQAKAPPRARHTFAVLDEDLGPYALTSPRSRIGLVAQPLRTSNEPHEPAAQASPELPLPPR